MASSSTRLVRVYAALVWFSIIEQAEGVAIFFLKEDDSFRFIFYLVLGEL